MFREKRERPFWSSIWLSVDTRFSLSPNRNRTPFSSEKGGETLFVSLSSSLSVYRSSISLSSSIYLSPYLSVSVRLPLFLSFSLSPRRPSLSTHILLLSFSSSSPLSLGALHQFTVSLLSRSSVSLFSSFLSSKKRKTRMEEGSVQSIFLLNASKEKRALLLGMDSSITTIMRKWVKKRRRHFKISSASI